MWGSSYYLAFALAGLLLVIVSLVASWPTTFLLIGIALLLIPLAMLAAARRPGEPTAEPGMNPDSEQL